MHTEFEIISEMQDHCQNFVYFVRRIAEPKENGVLKIVKKSQSASLLKEHSILKSIEELGSKGFPKVISYKVGDCHDELIIEALGPSLGKLIRTNQSLSVRTAFLLGL